MGIDLILALPQVERWLDELQDSLDGLPSQYRPNYLLMDEIAAAEDFSRLSEAAISQPLCTALQIVQVNLLREIGFSISAVAGHSSGEIAAAYAAGVISAVDAIRIAHLRGLVAKLAGSGRHSGAMAAAGMGVSEARDLCNQREFRGRVNIAAFNSPQSVTLSGDSDAIDKIADLLKSQQKFVRVLKVDKAYHSHHMKPCSKAYLMALQSADIKVQASRSTRWFSSLKQGREIGHSELEPLQASYWVDNMLEPVCFTQAVKEAVQAFTPDLVVEMGPHAALKGPVRQTLADSLPSANSANIPYISLLTRGESGLDCFAAALGSFWAIAGPASCSLHSYAELSGSCPSSMIAAMKSLPTYPFDHAKSYWAESRVSAAFAYKSQAPHLLLGTPTTYATDGEWCWRNYLRPSEIPWLSGHKIESQIVFPATGYIVMAVEAAAIIAGTRSLRLIQLHNLQIDNAIALKDSSSLSADVEILFKVQNWQTSASHSSATAEFSCHAAFAGVFRRCAHGSIEMTFGDQNRSLLPSRNSPHPNLSEVDVDELYSYLKEFGYGYEDLFRGITKCSRKKDLASGFMMNAAAMDADSSLIVHPAMMDTLLQGFLTAIGECHDGRLYTLFVPTGISRIAINPFFGGSRGLSDDRVEFDARVTDADQSGVEGDAAIFDRAGNCAIQFDGVKVSPLMAPTAVDDRLMFSEVIWGPLCPTVMASKVPSTTEFSQEAKIQEHLTILYMKQLLESISVNDSFSNCPSGEKIVRWFNHVIQSVQADTHQVCTSEWLNDSIDNTRAKLDANSFISRAICAIGDNMIPLVRGETAISDVLQLEHDFLHRLSRELVNSDLLEQMGSVAHQITFRYPHMKVLEIGAGVGSTTGSILDGIGQAFYSYTYTDSSPDSFAGAKERFSEYSERFIYRILDMSVSPSEQGFTENSYDLVVATNLMHPTVSLQETLARVRSLLKPGGYLLLAACINTDILGVSFIYSSFENGWLNESGGHGYGPPVALESWSTRLRAAGFSGLDSISPGYENKSRPFFVLVSQAVDNSMLCLREPLAYAGHVKLANENLYIIGGNSPCSAELVHELQATLSQFFKRIVTAPTLHSSDLGQLAPMSAALILDVDGPLLKDMTEPQFEGLKLVIDTCHTVLWISCGSESKDPHIGRNDGLLRSVAFENPHARYAHFNIDGLESVQASIIAEQLLRMELVKSDNDYALRSRVWSTETELRVEGGRVLIPRLKSEPLINKRYMSSRRIIHDQLDMQKSNISVAESGRLFEVTEAAGDETTGATVRIRVRYSTSSPLRFEGADPSYLVIGADQSTGARVLTLSSSRQSLIIAPLSWCRAVPSSVNAAKEAAYLYGVELSLLSQTLLRRVDTGSTIIVYKADEAVQLAISTAAASLDLKLVLVTTGPDNRALAGYSTIAIHEMTSNHELMRLLRSHSSSAAVFFDAERSRNADKGLGSHLESIFAPHVRRENVHSLRNISAKLSMFGKVRYPTTVGGFLETARCEALELAASRLIPSLVDVQQVGAHAQLFGIIDWTKDKKVAVRVQPSASTVHLSPTKTYLLVGMTGNLGRSVAEWMISRGARHLVLTSRNPKVEKWWIDEMANNEAKVLFLAM